MQNGIYLPELTKVNKLILIVIGAVFLLTSILSQGMNVGTMGILGLSSQGIIPGLITYPLISLGIVEVVFNALLFWFIGCDLERSIGTKKYLGFLAASVIGGGIIFLLCSFLFTRGGLTLTGLTGVTSAMLVVYAIMNPEQVFSFMLLFPIKAKYFCGLLLLIQLYMGIFSPGAVLAWGHIGAVISGVLFYIFTSNRKIDLGFKMPKMKKRRKTHLHVVHDDDKITWQ